jgi:hypothetical protein
MIYEQAACDTAQKEQAARDAAHQEKAARDAAHQEQAARDAAHHEKAARDAAHQGDKAGDTRARAVAFTKNDHNCQDEDDDIDGRYGVGVRWLIRNHKLLVKGFEQGSMAEEKGVRKVCSIKY